MAVTAEQIVEQSQHVLAARDNRVARVAEADAAQKAADVASSIASTAEAAEDNDIATLKSMIVEYTK